MAFSGSRSRSFGLVVALAALTLGSLLSCSPQYSSKKAQARAKCTSEGHFWDDATGCSSEPFDTILPVVTGLGSSSTPAPSVTWNWECSETPCTYRYIVDQDTLTEPSGEFGSTTTASDPGISGTYYLHVQARDAAGNLSDVVHVFAVIDADLPSAPTSLALLSPASSPGSVASPVIRISGVETGTTLSMHTSSNCSVASQVASVVAGSSTMDLTASTLGSDGAVSYYARVTDSAGNVSACSTASVTYTLDTQTPTVTGLSNDTTVTRAKSWTWGCSETGCSYAFVVDSNPEMPPDAVFSSTVGTALSTGTGRFYLHVQARDAAGNLSPLVHVFVDLDNTAPAAPSALVLSSPSTSPGTDSTPDLLISGVTSGDTITLHGDSSCATAALVQATANASTITLTAPAITSDSARTYYAAATDPLGNRSPCSTASVSYTLDTQAPVVTGLSSDATQIQSKTWTWSCTDGGAGASCSYAYLVDRVATTDPGTTYVATTTVTQGSGSGTYWLHVRARDAAGNLSAVTHVSAELDNTGPGTPSALVLQSPATSPANDSTPTLRVSGVDSGEKITLYFDSSCSSAASAEITSTGTTVDITTNTLGSDGDFEFFARSKDSLGNLSNCSTASLNYTLDTAIPSVTGITDDTTVARSKTWTWSCSQTPCRYSYSIDSSPTTDPSSLAADSTTTATLSAGTGRFYIHVVAHDAAGNASAPVHGYVDLDNTPPTAPTAVARSNPTAQIASDSTPDLLISGVSSGDTITLHTDSSCGILSQKASATATASTITLTSSSLTDGNYSFYAKATDPLGNESSCSTAYAQYTVDTTAPSAPSGISLLTPSSSPATSNTPQFRVSGVSSGVTVKLFTDSGCSGSASASATATGTTIDLTSSSLAEGAYTFYAQAEDSIGNASPCSSASATYTRDITAPIPTLSTTTANPITSGTATLTVTFNEPVLEFGTGSLQVYGGEVQLVSASSDTFIFSLTPTAQYGETITVGAAASGGPEGVLTSDLAGNASMAASSGLSWLYQPSASTGGSIVASKTQTQGLARAVTTATTTPAVLKLDVSLGGDAKIPFNQGISRSFSKIVVNRGTLNSACGIETSTNDLYCWGFGSYGVLGNSTSTTRTTPYKVVAPSPAPATPVRYTDISMGTATTCAISKQSGETSGKLYCWGRNTMGELGQGSTTPTTRAVPIEVVITGETFTQVDVGQGSYVCAVTASSNLYCWGDNTYGTIGNGTTGGMVLTPYLVGSGYATVSTGGATVCAIKAGSGDLYCWGTNGSGMLGVGTSSGVYPTPQKLAGTGYLGVVTQGYHSCAIRSDQTVTCWGNYVMGRLGEGVIAPRYSPASLGTMGVKLSVPTGAPDQALTGVVKLSIAHNMTCALTNSGSVYCWGNNPFGQVDGGVQSYRSTAVLRSLGAGETFVDFAINAQMACGLVSSASGSETRCWGQALPGSAALPFSLSYPIPMPLSETDPIQSLSNSTAGALCVITTSGVLKCAGYGYFGYLGLGINPVNASTFSVVGTDYTQVDTADQSACAIKTNGDLYCWGMTSSNGRFGNGVTGAVQYNAPRYIAGGFESVSVSTDNGCAIKTNGELYCWGANTSGQVGVGGLTTQFSQVRVGANLGSGLFAKVSAGTQYACAIERWSGSDSGGALYCWGKNDVGQLGIGSLDSEDLPQRVGASVGSGKFKKVDAGNGLTCALTDTDQLYCWGKLTAAPAFVNSTTPIQIASPGAGEVFSELSVHSHLCTITLNGSGTKRLYCAGTGGILGDGTSTTRSSLTFIGPGYSKVSVGDKTQLTVRDSDGKLHVAGTSAHVGPFSVRSRIPSAPYGSCTITSTTGTITNPVCSCDGVHCYLNFNSTGTTGTVNYSVTTPDATLGTISDTGTVTFFQH